MKHSPLSVQTKSPWMPALALLCAGILSSCAAAPEAAAGYVDQDKCKACGRCVKNCPVMAIDVNASSFGNAAAHVDEELCLGCGVCNNSSFALEPSFIRDLLLRKPTLSTWHMMQLFVLSVVFLMLCGTVSQ